MKPTNESYEELQKAYDHYNVALFANRLPSCLITLQRKSQRVLGYFSHDRFESAEGLNTDELAMNPMHFHTRSTEAALSTLVHEMVHVWQAHHGKPGRGRFHNREWAVQMKKVGLHPSNTGRPGGRETGDQMTHYIIEGGAFEHATTALVVGGFKLTWAEQPTSCPGSHVGVNPVSVDRNRTNRVRYQCPECQSRAWGKPGLNLFCGDCTSPFSPVL